jgi:YVTN family beta-propeller protein
MRKFFQRLFCSQTSVAFTFSVALCLAILAVAPSNAFAKDNKNAYVVSNINGAVDVIDPRTDTVTATISGFTHPFCLTVSPNGKLLYVCNTNNTVSVVDTESNLIKATISLPGALGFVGQEGFGPNVAFSRHGERAYVVTSGGGVNSSLFVIDTESSTVLSSQSFGATFLLAVAASRDNDNLYLATTSGILVVDADGDAATTTIASGHFIGDLALSPNGEKLYASDSSSVLGPPNTNGVLVVNTDTNTLEATVPLPGSPSFITGLAVTPDGRHVYVEDFFFLAGNSTITVIDTRDNSIDTTITANGLSLTSLAITTNGKKVLATNAVLSTTVHSTVAVIDTRDNTITDSITVGLFSDVVATQPAGNHRGDDDHGDDDGDHNH